MNSQSRYRGVIRRWIPPGIRDLANRLLGTAITFRGTYETWEAATRASGGYSDEELFSRIESAANAVKRGEAGWEQDGVVHADAPPDFPQLACVAQAALSNDGHLSVLDFGGGFGSSYHQARKYLRGAKSLRWHVVEQTHVARSGQRNFQTDELLFHESLAACLDFETPNLVLLSAVLQYLPDPYGLLGVLQDRAVEFIAIDRTPKSMSSELITVQVLPASLYPASYPSWLFDFEKVDSFLSGRYAKIMSWEGKDPPIRGRGIGAEYVGGFWQRRRSPDA